MKFRSVILIALAPALLPVATAATVLGDRLQEVHGALLDNRREALPSLSNPFGTPDKARLVIERSDDALRQFRGWRSNVVGTIFWIGEQPTQNNPVPNHMSSWDMNWQENFGGYDDPDRRKGYLPAGFVPKLNPFYIALPYNDVMRGGHHHPLPGGRPQLSQIPNRRALPMKVTQRRSWGRGYTLLELSLAMATGIVVAVMMLALVNQQIAFLRIYNAQNFLSTEAPLINNYLVRVIGSAEGYRLYESVDDLRDGSPPVMADAPVIMLRFKEPDGTFRASVLSFENPGTGQGLYYRMVTPAGVLGTPDWAITKRPANVTFSIVQGILRVRVTGPNGEEIFYSGTQQL